MNKLMEMHKKLSKNEKRILFLTITILGFVFIDKVIVLPITTTLGNLNASIHDQETSIKKSMKVLLHKDGIIEENHDYIGYSVEAKDPEEETVGLLKDIEVIAEKSGVNLLFVKPGKVDNEKGIKRYYASLECEAQMEQVGQFFHGIESSTKLLKIEKYQIQPKSKDSSIARSSVTIYKTVLKTA